METRTDGEQVLFTREQHRFILREWVPRLMAGDKGLTAVNAYERAAREYRALMVGLSAVMNQLPSEHAAPRVMLNDTTQLLVDEKSQDVFIRPCSPVPPVEDTGGRSLPDQDSGATVVQSMLSKIQKPSGRR